MLKLLLQGVAATPVYCSIPLSSGRFLCSEWFGGGNLRFGGANPRFCDKNLRFVGGNPRFGDENLRFGGENPRFRDGNLRIGGGTPRFEEKPKVWR